MIITAGGQSIYSGYGTYSGTSSIGPIVFTATSTAALTIASGTFSGSITSIILQGITTTQSTTAMSIQNSDGSQGFEVRSGGPNLRNAFLGYQAGLKVIGTDNYTFGYQALNSCVVGAYNVAIGSYAAQNNIANNTISIGYQALQTSTTSNDAISIGYKANQGQTSAGGSIAIGSSTYAGGGAIAIGSSSAAAASGISIGQGIGNSANTGFNILIGYGNSTSYGSNSQNIVIGYNSSSISGGNNTILGGYYAGYGVAGSNTAIGYCAMGAIAVKSSASSNVALGANAGKYQTGSNNLFINNQDRTNFAGDQTLSLLYGTFASTAASQQLTINGNLTVNGGELGKVNPQAANYTLLGSDAVVVATASGVTFALPAAATAIVGQFYYLSDTSGSGFSIAPNGTDKIAGANSALAVAAYGSKMIACVGVGFWGVF